MANLPELEKRWLALNTRHGSTDAESEWFRIKIAYEEPHRAYHNLDHIEYCLLMLDTFSDLEPNSNAVEYAIWYHDIVYDVHARDNEQASANRSSHFFNGAPLMDEVHDLIMVTRHGENSLFGEYALMADIDLAILGDTPAAYDVYAAKIRQEYQHVDAPIYADKRCQVLQTFLDKKAIYYTHSIQQQRESQARDNLQREITHLATG